MPNSSTKVDLVKTERNKTHLFIVDIPKVNKSGRVGYSLSIRINVLLILLLLLLLFRV